MLFSVYISAFVNLHLLQFMKFKYRHCVIQIKLLESESLYLSSNKLNDCIYFMTAQISNFVLILSEELYNKKI